MPDRSLTYRITIDTSQAKAQASSMRALFEAELKQISVGKLDTSGVQAAIAHVKALSKGGSNSDGTRLEPPSKNRSSVNT